MSQQSIILFIAFLSALSLTFGLTGDVTLPSSGIVINSNLKLYYQTDATSITMLVDATTYGWVGIGFGASMTNTDMVLFTTVGNTVLVQDIYSTGHVSPNFIESQDWAIIGQDWTSGSFKVKVQRMLNSGDSQDRVLTANSQYQFCAAWAASQSFSAHTGYTSYSVNLSNNLGLQTAIIIETGVSETVLNLHKVVLFYGWGIAVDIAVFFARYMRTWKHYLIVHAGILFFLDILTIIFIALVIDGNKEKLDHSSQLSKNTQSHFIIGCIILGILILQHIMGVVLKFAIEGTSKKVHMIKRFHQFGGIFLYIICKANIIIGTSLTGQTGGGIVIVAASTAFLIISEIVFRFQSAKSKKIDPKLYMQVQMVDQQDRNTPLQNELLQLLNVEKRDNEQILATLPEIKWVIFHKGIYDITNFVHPGGQYFINQLIGKEIGRYLNGSLSLEGYDGQPHTHSAAALNLLQQFFIGNLNYSDSNTITLDEISLQKPSKNSDNNILQSYNEYQIQTVVKISETTSRFEFRSDEGIRLRNVMKGVNWLGRHFSIRTPDNPKSRLYTQVISMSEDNIALRNSLIAFAVSRSSPSHYKIEEQSVINISGFRQYSPTLTLIIKKYDFKGALSKFIHESSPNEKYLIQGPLGTGFFFNEDFSEKSVGIFCGGTGVLPFLDLLDFLLKKTLQESVLSVNDKAALDPFGINYSSYFKNCKFTMYASFRTLKDFIGAEWITKLHALSSNLKKDFFKLNIKISSGETIQDIPQIQQKSFGDIVNQLVSPTTFDKVFICGPPVMYSNIHSALKAKQIPQNRIYNV